MRHLLHRIALARRYGGKTLPRQLFEIFRLRLQKMPIGVGEYFDYGIWHQSITAEMRDEFIGWRHSAVLDRQLNEDYSRVLANDKLLNYLILNAAGYPIPRPVATFTRNGRRIANEPTLGTFEEVQHFLDSDIYPLYVKPISAGYGRGVMGIAGKSGNSLRLLDDTSISLEEFRKPFEFLPYQGMLFQQPLEAHPDIQQITGTNAICCVRFICLVTPSGPSIHLAFWKITAGNNMLDNFSHGDYGNCLGSIDLASGGITHAIARMGPGGSIDRHPTTQKKLIGFKLPFWSQAIELVLAASTCFPGLRLQNWDVALCPEGPVLLELNTESELNVPQAISGRGFMNPSVRSLLAEIEADRKTRQAAVLQRDNPR